MRIANCLVVVLLSIPAMARAQSEREEPRSHALVEVRGGWGVQIGETEYLPDGAATEYKYPFVSGWTIGGTAGWLFVRDVALIATYEYRTAALVDGDVPGVIDEVDGKITYHTAVLGVRLYRDAGPGRLRFDLGAGVVFPFETEREFDWGPALVPAGIRGTGTQTDEYSIGYGVAAQAGYELSVGGPLYLGLGLEVRSFQSDNNHEKTELENMVTDFAAVPPVAVNTTIEYEDGAAQPRSYSVQEIGARVALGVRF
jgi:hypothetical protein